MDKLQTHSNFLSGSKLATLFYNDLGCIFLGGYCSLLTLYRKIMTVQSFPSSLVSTTHSKSIGPLWRDLLRLDDGRGLFTC